ncbi:MAG: ASKHA domain-containing protein [Bacillota bacterium]|nr:ASKHA domain-containing protein [Bacillota bacterium]
MKKNKCLITLAPEGREITGVEGDSLYTLLLVAGAIRAGQADGDKVRLERGMLSEAEDPSLERAAFSSSERADGWILASQHKLLGDAVIALNHSVVEQPPSGQPLARGYGLAVDVGTGTIAAGLVNLGNMQIPDISALRNSQGMVGEDINDRISWCRSREDGLTMLHQMVWRDINTLAAKLIIKAGISPDQVNAVSLVGNFAICRMLWHEQPFGSYGDEWHHIQVKTAAEVGLTAINPAAKLYLLPAAANDIGADTVAAVMATELTKRLHDQRLTLLVDLGMSGEIIIAGRGRLLAASVSALPFEGASISCGMSASTGAITRVYIGDDVTLQTVRDGRPRGLCGAGLISAVHMMLEHGMLDQEGRIVVNERLPQAVLRRLRGTVVGREFLLSAGGGLYGDICINQNDIRETQLAKGAIYAACQALLAEFGADEQDIEEIWLAEAFRAHIDPASALKVGLIPDVEARRVVAVDNAAWQGVYMALSNGAYLSESEDIAALIRRLDLSVNMVYAEQFLAAMNFASAEDDYD